MPVLITPGVDPRSAARHDRDLGGDAEDHWKQLGARLVRLLLGVVERPERTNLGGPDRVEVEQHRGGHERAGEAPAAGLVGAGDEPRLEGAVEPEQPAGGGNPALAPRRRYGRRPVNPARGTRFDQGAST